MAQASANAEQTGSWKSGKNRYIAAFLAWLLGAFGAHKFYIGQRKTGLLYLAFFWTAIPLLLGFGHAVRYLLMSNEEFHRRITMDQEEFEEWEEQASEDSESPRTVGKKIEQKNEERIAKKEEELSSLPDNYTEQAKGDYVTKKRLLKVEDILDDDETVYYLTRGSTVDVEGSSAGSSLFGDDRSRKTGTKGWVRAVYTDKRVAVKVPQVLGDDERSIPYHSVTSVDLDTGLQTKRFSLQTPGQTYHIETHDPGKDECREIVRFVRDKIAEANQQESVVTQEADPTEQLQNLKDLHDEGVVSDEEFEEKRQRLLEKIE